MAKFDGGNEFQDMVGNLVQAGNYISYPVRRGSSLDMQVIQVTKVTQDPQKVTGTLVATTGTQPTGKTRTFWGNSPALNHCTKIEAPANA